MYNKGAFRRQVVYIDFGQKLILRRRRRIVLRH
jgi:hypothetical protein